jgi:hypothetical protein
VTTAASRFFALLLVASCVSCRSLPRAIEQMSTAYRAHRHAPTDDSAWLGHQHQRQQALVAYINDNDLDGEQVHALLGEPDAVEKLPTTEPAPWFALIALKPNAASVVAYFWRGQHDFLYVVYSHDGHVLHADMAYAYE